MKNQAAAINSDNLVLAACKVAFKVGVADGKSGKNLRNVLREGTAHIAQGGEAFDRATRDIRDDYSLGCLVGAGYAKTRDAALDVVATNKDKDNRDDASYQCVRTAHANFSHAMKACGFKSSDKRAGNARKPGGTQAQAVKASDKPAVSGAEKAKLSAELNKAAQVTTVPTFTKDYDAKTDMGAIAARLSKAIAQKPGAFAGGLHAIASDFITAMAAFQKAQANAEQN